jgi:hypothetical protein
MTTFRIQHSKDFTVIANSAIRDNALSFRARGLHHLLLSFRDDWIVNEKHLVSSTDKEGREAVRAAIKELVDAGYVIRNQQRNSNTGAFAQASYDVFELPQTTVAQEPAHGAVAQEPDSGSPDSGNPVIRLPVDGKPVHLINNYSTKIDLTKTDLKKTPLPPLRGDVRADRKLEKPGQGEEEEQAETSTTIEANAIEPLSTGKAEAGKKGSARRRSQALPKKPGDRFIPEGFEMGDLAIQGLVGRLVKGFPTIAAVEAALPAEALDRFDKFWGWYERNVSGLPRASAPKGDRKRAMIAFAICQESDFFGHGADGFRDGGVRAAEGFRQKQGVGAVWAAYFLVGKDGGQPYWLPAPATEAASSNDFLPEPEPQTKSEGGRPFDRLSSIRGAQTAVTGLLRSLNRPSVLPDDWQAKTGKQIVSQLTATELAEFAEYLKLELNGHAV